MHHAQRIFLITICLALSNVSAQAQASPSPTPQQRIDQLEKRISSLQSQVVTLSKDLQKVRTDVAGLRIQLRSKQDTFREITLDLASRGFQRLDTDSGFFLVSIRDVVPYLEGHKIVLDVGNPSFATYVGIKINVRWGPTYDWDNFSEDTYKKWEESVQEKEVHLPGSLRPGVWNKVELLLSPASAKQLGFVDVSIKVDTVSFLKEP